MKTIPAADPFMGLLLSKALNSLATTLALHAASPHVLWPTAARKHLLADTSGYQSTSDPAFLFRE